MRNSTVGDESNHCIDENQNGISYQYTTSLYYVCPSYVLTHTNTAGDPENETHILKHGNTGVHASTRKANRYSFVVYIEPTCEFMHGKSI